MNEKKKNLKFPLIVEGKYDKCVLSSLFSLGGFSVFNSKEKQTLLRRISQNGVILLTDSDGGGKQLRSFVSGILPKDKVYNLYIPKIKGKERRKTKSSKEGYLGVEGMEPEVLLKILSPFTVESDSEHKALAEISMADFYLAGFSGGENSSVLRAELAKYLGLPADMTAKALLAAINLLSLQKEYEDFVNNNLQISG